ncbi:hypothetical protein EV368DRAFT_46593 [Lentinula lateritia]|nr:hypothetical protein EV368DRAFT_46593 [Lentinula lateritia]
MEDSWVAGRRLAISELLNNKSPLVPCRRLAISDLLNLGDSPPRRRRLAISELLNQETGVPLVRTLIPELSNTEPGPPSGPQVTPSTFSQSLPSLTLSSSVNVAIQRQPIHANYRLNRKTTLSSVYQYSVGAVVEYPDSAVTGVGHLFEMNRGGDWHSPVLDFAYSRGQPCAQARGTSTSSLLVSSTTGEQVPCILRHSTCQGVKVCQFADIDRESHHFAANREELRDRLLRTKEAWNEFTSPLHSRFEKTVAYLAALTRSGCPHKTSNPVPVIGVDGPNENERRTMRRGYPELSNRCPGSMRYGVMIDGTPYIKDHFFDQAVGNGSYDTEYIEAVLSNDQEEISRIESEAESIGYGPKTECSTVVNRSSQRLVCAWSHRDGEGSLKQPKLELMPCSCTFREFIPVEEFRDACPYILIISKGPHSHPVPFPEKTPVSVKVELDQLLRKLDQDLADIAPRSFLRHPVVQSYLSTNHLKVYIESAKRSCFPAGTGWKGLLYVKERQDSELPCEEHYIRTMLELSTSEQLTDEEDLIEDQGTSSKDPLRIVICMSKTSGRRFLEAQYLQSDIAFKRIIGFYEFEVAYLDEFTNTSVTLCRVYLTKQTAFAHLQVLREVNKLLKKDFGQGLRWRHIHGLTINDYDNLILNWVVDQHRGQAKGIGLFLQELSAEQPRKQDFHQPHRTIQELGPYDHLSRFLTLCTTHYVRNIRKCPVSEQVRNMMRSLSCIEHHDWDGTLQGIVTFGEKAGQNWLLDKESSKFAFPAICWEKSFIPLDIWQARCRESNVVEVVHANVNLEGINCSLVGGVIRGKRFDLMKERALRVRNHFVNSSKSLLFSTGKGGIWNQRILLLSSPL